MPEHQSPEPSLLKRVTGANTHEWLLRAQRFIEKPERRQYMIGQLATTLKLILVSRSEKEKSSDRYEVMQKATGAPGTENYHFTVRSGFPEWMMLTILPENTIVEELKNEDNKISKQPWMHAEDLLEYQNKIDPSHYHFIVTPPAMKVGSENEMPLRGYADGGKVTKLFISKYPQNPERDECYGGAIVFENNGLRIIPYSEIESTIPKGQRIEQAIYTASDTNWQNLLPIIEAPYNNHSQLLVGYFQKNDQKKYFALMANSQPLVRERVFNALQQVKTKNSYDGFSVACLEFLAGFAGGSFKINSTQKYYGPSTNGRTDTEFLSHAHPRIRFLNFRFPKK